MPRINYILDQLREARYISSLDPKHGYWQIPLEESSGQDTEGNAVRTSLGVGNVSASFGPSSWPRDVTSRIRLPG